MTTKMWVGPAPGGTEGRARAGAAGGGPGGPGRGQTHLVAPRARPGRPPGRSRSLWVAGARPLLPAPAVASRPARAGLDPDPAGAPPPTRPLPTPRPPGTSAT
jgi:hypothetical protein